MLFRSKVLDFCLRKKIVPLAIAIGLFVICTLRVFSTGLSMLDDMESNQISGTITMNEDTDDDTAIATADKATEIMLSVDGVDKVSVLDAGAGSGFVSGGSDTEADYSSFSFFIITDSGGMQEEAPSLGKPVLVVRRETERPEAVEAGTVKLAGVERDTIFQIAESLLADPQYYAKMAEAVNPYGDGKASERIINALRGRR
mgnify:CR=1 FL=1